MICQFHSAIFKAFVTQMSFALETPRWAPLCEPIEVLVDLMQAVRSAASNKSCMVIQALAVFTVPGFVMFDFYINL